MAYTVCKKFILRREGILKYYEHKQILQLKMTQSTFKR